MTAALVHMMVILTAITTTLTVELVVGVRQGVAQELGADPPCCIYWLGKSLEQCA